MLLIAAQGLLDQLRQYELLEPGQFDELAHFPARRRTEARGLAQELLDRDWLTPFQANHLLRGEGAGLILGPYVLLDRLGSGGTGQVFKAQHRAMRRLVALKLIRPELLENPEVVARFHREVRIASRLTHPHVIHAFDAGAFGNAFYLAMEFVPGTDLARLVKLSGPLPIPQVCDYVRQAALGLQHAHECNLVHRDIKPPNLLVVVPRGGIAPAPGGGPWGLIKLLDLGLARLHQHVDGDTTNLLTPMGQTTLGTPDYVAPEQALDFHRADIRADIYSLGCTLYFLLAGQPPFTGGSLAEKLMRHQQAEPPPLNYRRPDAPPQLHALLHRMLAKRPDQRPQTPGEVAEVLAQLLASGRLPTGPAVVGPDLAVGRFAPAPVATRVLPTYHSDSPSTAILGDPTAKLQSPPVAVLAPPTPAVRSRLLVVGVLLVAFGLLANVVALISRGRTAPGPVGAASTSSVERGATNGQSNLDPEGTHPLLKPGLVVPEAERFAWQPGELVAVFGTHRGGHWGPVQAVAWNAAGDLAASGGEDHTVRLWDAAGMRERAVLRGPAGPIVALAFSPDGKMLAAASRDGTVRTWDLQVSPPREMKSMPGPRNGPAALAWAPDGKRLAVGEEGEVRLWNLANGQAEPATSKQLGLVAALAFTPDGKTLAAGGKGNSVVLWDVVGDGLRERAALRGPGREVLCLAFSADGAELAAGGGEQTIRRWDLAPREPAERPELRFSGGGVQALAFAPDGKTLRAAARDGTLRSWETGGDRPHSRVLRDGKGGDPAACAFTVGGTRIAFGNRSGGVRVWEQAGNSFKETPVGEGRVGAVLALALSPDGRTLLFSRADGLVQATTFTNAAIQEAPLKGHYGGERFLAFAPDGKTCAGGGFGPTVKLWDLAKTRELAELTTIGKVRAVAFGADGKLWAVSGADDAPHLWVAAEQGLQDRGPLPDIAGTPSGVAFGPGGQLAAASNGSLAVWNLGNSEGRKRLELPAWAGSSQPLAFAPDGKTLAAAASDRSVHLWRLSGPESHVEAVVRNLPNRVVALALAPDGRLAVAGSGFLHLYDGVSAQRLREWWLPGGVNSLAFAADGRLLFLGNDNGAVYALRLDR